MFYAIVSATDHVIRRGSNECFGFNALIRRFRIRSSAFGGKILISEGIDMPMEQSNPDKGLLMIGAVAGGILLLVLLATFFGAI